MKIKSIKISNYRNLNECFILFDPEANYIIGENNLGKSNLLHLLDTICNGRAFEEKDFDNPEIPIEIILGVKLLPNEFGFFGDNFSPSDHTTLNLGFKQKIDDAFPTIVNFDTGESILSKQLKTIHFIKYDTTIVPSKELRIDTQKGAGILVNSIIESYIKNDTNSMSFINETQINNLKNHINNYLGKIRGFKDYSIKATISDNPNEMLSKMFYLSDGERTIDSTGSGIQFIATATINILCQIMNIYKSKSVVFENHLYTDDNGKKILPVVLSVDEPEVHLHPFLQRSLIRYYKRILQNKDQDFVDLLKMCFEIDGLDGQLLIVTHSTDVLIGNYQNLIRFFQDSSGTKIISGASLNLNGVNEKHLLMHFAEIKEAFYAKCVILIEGVTEYGCIQSFAETLDISLDDNGICVINACGEGSIKPIKQLLDKFAIPSISIYDSDVKQGQTQNENEFFTKELCFEIEVVKNLYDKKQIPTIKQIVQDLDTNGENDILDAGFVKKPFQKLGINLSSYTPKKLSDISESNSEEFCNMYSSWYMAKKGVLLGRIIGQALTAELIPLCYADAIRKAREVAQNV